MPDSDDQGKWLTMKFITYNEERKWKSMMMGDPKYEFRMQYSCTVDTKKNIT